MNFIEKRDYMRMDVSYGIYCKLVQDKENRKAWCTSLSGSGVCFLCRYEFPLGQKIEVIVPPETDGGKTLKFFVIITRCQAKNELFEIGGVLHNVKDDLFETISYRLNR